MAYCSWTQWLIILRLLSTFMRYLLTSSLPKWFVGKKSTTLQKEPRRIWNTQQLQCFPIKSANHPIVLQVEAFASSVLTEIETEEVHIFLSTKRNVAPNSSRLTFCCKMFLMLSRLNCRINIDYLTYLAHSKFINYTSYGLQK